jgi:trimethylamine--corrinoid protein Co-methyltransferase
MSAEQPEPAHIIKPKLTVLDSATVERIHSYSLQILASVGVRVDSERAIRLFGQALGSAAIDGNRVRIPSEIVNWAIAAAASTIEIYDRLGHLAFRLPGETRFGIGVTALYYQEPVTNHVTPFLRQHMESMVRLGSALSSFDVISTVGIIHDTPPEVSDAYAILEMVANTIKPLVVLVSDEKVFPALLDLLEHLSCDDARFPVEGQHIRRSLAYKPFVLPYFNPISPLVINEGTADKMFAAIDRGLPIIYSNYGMAGASTPITPAGTLALLNAELLAGLVLSQLIREGTPVVLGSLPAYFDMKGTGSFYDIRSYLINLACAEMMAFYRLPHAGASGAGMGWGPDLIAAGHQWTNHLLSCIGKVGLAPFIGDNLGAMAFSPALVVLAHDIIQQARLFAQGSVVDDAAIGLEEIARVGPGGDFIITPQTLRLFRQAYHRSEVLPNLSLDEWQKLGRPEAGEVLGTKTRQLLSNLATPEDHADLIARGEEFIQRRWPAAAARP